MTESLNEIEKVFMAFGDKTRLRLLYLMKNGEVSVNFLCESLEISQPKVSRHLAYLRSMSVVHTRRDGKWIYYRLNEPQSRMGSQLLRDALAWIGSTPEIGGSAPNVSQQFQLREAAHVDNSRQVQDIYDNTHMSPVSDELEVYLL